MRPFLETLERTGNVTLAARAAGVSRNTPYEYRETHPDHPFVEEWEQAAEVSTDVLEAEARRRAQMGVAEPVFGSLRNADGKVIGMGQIGAVQKYSDTLLIFLLKAARPAKYRDRFDVNVNVTESEVDRRLREAWEEHLRLTTAPPRPRTPSKDPGDGAHGGEEPAPQVGL
jgi:hypothetical protein